MPISEQVFQLEQVLARQQEALQAILRISVNHTPLSEKAREAIIQYAKEGLK